MLITETIPEVYVSTMTTFISNSYCDFKETHTHTKSLKLKSFPVETVTDYSDAILLDSERLDISRDFNTDHLGYIPKIFEDIYDSIFRLWEIYKYKEVIDFIKKLRVCDMGVIKPGEIITYESLLQEYRREYHKLVYSKRWDRLP